MSRIEVICGPMFSGKSEELMRRLNRATIAKRKFQLFKPSGDVRYSEDEVVSHAGQKMECSPVRYARDILKELRDDPEIVAVDEAQFFSSQLMDTVLSLTTRGLRVIVAGLDMDSDGVPFGPMGNIMAMAESVTKLAAVCEECGDDATHSLRISEVEGQLLLGEHDHYRAAWRKHWSKR